MVRPAWAHPRGGHNPIRLDEESVTYFKAIFEVVGIPYQSLINLYLRDCAASHRKLDLNWK